MSQRESKAVFPADMRVKANVVDPAGHRLVDLGRMFNEADPDRWFYEGDSIPRGVGMLESQARHHEIYPSVLTFECKKCHDAGLNWRSRLQYEDVTSAIAAAWDDCRANGFTTPTTILIRAVDAAL